MTEDDKREWKLEPNQEFRFEVDIKNILTVKLLEGRAELFGTELALDVEYQFTAKKLAIYTFHGCKIESSGNNISEYIGKETPMSSIINVHFALQKLREDAVYKDIVGPRVMIVGPSDVGKTALAKILVNYAARNRNFPVLCDLDPNGVNDGLFNVGVDFFA